MPAHVPKSAPGAKMPARVLQRVHMPAMCKRSTMLHSISEPCINSAELYFCPNVTQNDASAYDLMIKNYWGHFLSKYLKFFLILNENLDSI